MISRITFDSPNRAIDSTKIISFWEEVRSGPMPPEPLVRSAPVRTSSGREVVVMGTFLVWVGDRAGRPGGLVVGQGVVGCRSVGDGVFGVAAVLVVASRGRTS